MNSASSTHHCRTPRFDAGNPIAEAKVRRALWLTMAMMVVEIAGGWWFNSMAVLADGWYMSSLSLALGLRIRLCICAAARGEPALCLRHVEN